MAWWHARLLFHDDRLIDVGVHDFPPAAGSLVDELADSPELAHFTSVCVSGYALAGRLHGYYAIGVGHLQLDPRTGRVYGSEAGQRHAEPLTSLSAAQLAAVRDWLQAYSPEAWSSSLRSFQIGLAADDGTVPRPHQAPTMVPAA